MSFKSQQGLLVNDKPGVLGAAKFNLLFLVGWILILGILFAQLPTRAEMKESKQLALPLAVAEPASQHWGISKTDLLTTRITYTSNTTIFSNPERGFYHHAETHSNSYSPLISPTLQNYRQNENITLILRIFYLDDFVNNDISQTYLDKVQTDFDTLRASGLKAIVRFAYTNQPHFAPSTTWPPIPPYGDANLTQITRHLEQLTPILQADGDVIATVQTGFVGIWGEWYYTDHFVENPSDPSTVTAMAWLSRTGVLTAVLNALPTNRMTQVRTPLIKQKIYSRTTPINTIEGHNGSDIARTGHHNDCFLSSGTDFGTYTLPVENDKTYLEAETQYLPMGGETCALNSPRSDCATALVELSRFHWSYLNRDYHLGVLTSWQNGGCFAEIERRLGYRFTLLQGVFDNQVEIGNNFQFSLQLDNEGFAASINSRAVELILRHTVTGVTHTLALTDDSRFWLPGPTYTISHTLLISSTVPTGTYDLLLNLPDLDPRLHQNPNYAIRMANDNLWEAVTGYNKLNHTLLVLSSTLSSGENVYLPVIIK